MTLMYRYILPVILYLALRNPTSGKKTLASRFTYYLDGDSIDWPCTSTKNIYATSGRFAPRNIIPTRFQTKGLEAFLAFPRLRPGVPITLGKIKLIFGQSHPEIKPFPSWELQEEGNCDAIQNAVDVFLDCHHVLWVLDLGTVNTIEMPVVRCPPKVLGIDHRTGKILHRIDLSHLCYPTTRLQYIIADVAPNGCTYLYISDAETSSILVWDVTENFGTRVRLPVHAPKRDIMYTFLIRPKHGENLLGFTYLSGANMYCVKASALQRGICDRVIDLGMKPTQIVVLGTDNGSILFFRSKTDPKIYMWDALTPFQPGNFHLADKGTDCRLSTQVSGGCRLLMWSLDSNFQDFITGIVGSVGASASIHPLVATD